MNQPSQRALRIVEEIAHRTTIEHYRLLLNEEREPSITGSKIGGRPYWPAGKEFPVDGQGDKMLMIMQINCEEAGLRSPLPERGMLQWYISLNPERMYGCQGNYNEDGSGFCVCHHQDIIEEAIEVKAPTHDTVEDRFSPVKREVSIDIEREPTCMGVSDGRFNRLFFEIVKEITGTEHTDKMWYEYLDNPDCLYLEQNMGMKRPCHQMLGYPVYSQDEARRDIERHDTLLFQLDSQFSTVDRKELVMWGDMGSGFIYVNSEDLTALDFSRAYYCWDCG